MRSRRTVLLLLIVVGLVDASAETSPRSDGSGNPTIRCTDAAPQGGVLLVAAEANFGELIDADLRLQGRRISGPNRAFAVADGNNGEWRVVLIGVPTVAAVGTAEVHVRYAAHGGNGESVYGVTITASEFRTVEIALDKTMTDLRVSTDPRKARESRALWELLVTFDPGATHETGPFETPLRNPRMSSSFGEHRVFSYSDGNTAHAVHTGVDLAAPRGTVVFAPAAGQVAFAAERMLTGNTIVVEHLPGVYSLYYHLDRMDVAVGDTVGRSTVLGTVGSTGLVTGPHLHWEVRVCGVPVKPYQFTVGSVFSDLGL